MESARRCSERKANGRRKFEIKKIEKRSSLMVTFSKRRKGLFNKCAHLSRLCDVQIAALVSSPADRVFVFGDPSVDSIVDRFLHGYSVSKETQNSAGGPGITMASPADGDSDDSATVVGLRRMRASLLEVQKKVANRYSEPWARKALLGK